MANEPKEKLINGIVTEALPATTFRVEIDGQIVLCHLSGKMRIHYIKVMPGDRVMVRLSPDKSRGIVMKRL
ncbi:MAG TPA: translation initiation factor IF-1 [Candidatus Paceibacterota bacterium]|nr:translation initiation factor IF-1 [Candidatus Paceibacterota bacterium]